MLLAFPLIRFTRVFILMKVRSIDYVHVFNILFFINPLTLHPITLCLTMLQLLKSASINVDWTSTKINLCNICTDYEVISLVKILRISTVIVTNILKQYISAPWL